MRYIVIVLAMILCSAAMSVDAGAFVTNSSPEENERLVDFDLTDYLPFLKKKPEELNTTDPNLAFLGVSNILSAFALITWVSEVPCPGMLEYGTTQILDTTN